MDYVPGGATTVAHGDQEAVAAEDCGDVRRRATTRNFRRLTRREIASRYRTLTADGSQEPPEAIHGQGFNDGGPCAVADWAEATVMVKSCMTAFDGLRLASRG